VADEHEHHRAGEHARRARVPQSAPRQSPKRGRRTAAAGIGSGAGGIGGSSCASFVAGCLRSTRSTPFLPALRWVRRTRGISGTRSPAQTAKAAQRGQRWRRRIGRYYWLYLASAWRTLLQVILRLRRQPPCPLPCRPPARSRPPARPSRS
jgi:hypothetical protein